MKKYADFDKKEYLDYFSDQFTTVFPKYIEITRSNIVDIVNMLKRFFKSHMVNIYDYSEYSNAISIRPVDLKKRLDIKLDVHSRTKTHKKFDFENQTFMTITESDQLYYNLQIVKENGDYFYDINFYYSDSLYIDDKCIVYRGRLFVIDGMEDELDEHIKAIFIDPLKEDGE